MLQDIAVAIPTGALPQEFRALQQRRLLAPRARTLLQDSTSQELLAAASDGDTNAVSRLLQAGADPNATDSRGNTALILATANGHVSIVRLLLDAGADIDQQGQNELTPLAAAASLGEVSVLRFLIERGADLEKRDEHGDTPLILAIISADLASVRALLSGGAEVDGKGEERWTPLLIAANQGLGRIVKLLLESGADIEARTAFGSTPLHRGAASGSVEVVKALLDAGAEIEAVVAGNGNTALMTAAWNGGAAAATALLDAGADAFAADSSGRNALHLGAQFPSNFDVLQIMLDAGININATTDFGSTAVGEAARFGNKLNIEFLLEQGADPALRGEPICGCLDVEIDSAAIPCPAGNCESESDIEAIQDLLGAKGGVQAHWLCTLFESTALPKSGTKGLDVNSVSSFGNPPIEMAAFYGNLGGVQFLLENGADPGLAARNGAFDDVCGCVEHATDEDLIQCPADATCQTAEQIAKIEELMAGGAPAGGATPGGSASPRPGALADVESPAVSCEDLPTVLQRLECISVQDVST
eukprot:evm.model.scf_593.6 EVM.evm.TU.scf_593.6   scf_593:38359-53547(-)